MKSSALEAETVVLFKDTFEERSTPHYGIRFKDGSILCLCCGGIIEYGDYEILERIGFGVIDDILKKELLD